MRMIRTGKRLENNALLAGVRTMVRECGLVGISLARSAWITPQARISGGANSRRFVCSRQEMVETQTCRWKRNSFAFALRWNLAPSSEIGRCAGWAVGSDSDFIIW